MSATKKISLGTVMHRLMKRTLKKIPILEGGKIMLTPKEISLGKMPSDIDEEDLDKKTVISPDGRRAAYEATHENKYIVVVDGVKGKKYDLIDFIVFSPDSRHIAYLAKRNEKCFIVMDGVVGTEFDNFYGDGIKFSSDSKRAACMARRGNRLFLAMIEEDENDPET